MHELGELEPCPWYFERNWHIRMFSFMRSPAGLLLLVLFVKTLPPLVVNAWEPYTFYPPSVYIKNRTICWGCDNTDSDASSKPPIPPRGFQNVPCIEGPPEQCDQNLASPEAFLFLHRFLGNSNYFHFLATDFLPLLSLLMGTTEFALPTPGSETQKVNDTFVKRLERPYKIFAFAPTTDARNRMDHYFCQHEHINFLLHLFADSATLVEDDQVYCFEPSTQVWPLVSGMAIEGHQEGKPTKYAGLVLQTQLYVRQRVLNIQECQAPSKKPVLVWVERPKYLQGSHLVAPERYLYSWIEILDRLRNDFDVPLLDAGQLEPRELVHLLSQADILLGVHGAGLQNLVWMRPYRSVVEIRWPESKKVDRHYEQMSTHLHHFWSEVELYHLNVTQFMSLPLPMADQQRIVDVVRQAWENIKSFHSNVSSDGGSTDADIKDEL